MTVNSPGKVLICSVSLGLHYLGKAWHITTSSRPQLQGVGKERRKPTNHSRKPAPSQAEGSRIVSDGCQYELITMGSTASLAPCMQEASKVGVYLAPYTLSRFVLSPRIAAVEEIRLEWE